MAEHDTSFADLAVRHKLLSPARHQAATRAQALLQKYGIAKTTADITVEAGWLTPTQAAQLIQKIAGHPPLKARKTSPTPTPALRRVSPPMEQLSKDLAKIGYARSAADLMLDKGIVEIKDRPPAKRTVTSGTPSRPSDSGRPAGASLQAAPATKNKAPRGAPTPPRKSRTTLLVAAAVAVAATIALLAFTFSGRKDAAPEPKPEPPPAKRPEPETPPATVPVDPEEQMRREAEENRRKRAAEAESAAQQLFEQGGQQLKAGQFADAFRTFKKLQDAYPYTEFCKTRVDEIAKRIDEAKAGRNAPAPKVEPAKAPAGPDPALREAYEKRRAQRVEAARKRVQEAKAAIEADRAADAKRMADLKARLASQRFSLRTKAGTVFPNATIVELRREDLKIAQPGAQVTLTWDMLDDGSFAQIARAMHKTDGAAGAYELGRKFIMRKMWKEAKAAFDEAVKADASYEDRVPDLTPILTNQGAFRGLSRRLGRDTLSLTYDFSIPEQEEDFNPQRGGSSEVADGGLALKAKGAAYWTLKDVDYDGDFLLESTVSLDGDAAPAFMLFMNWEGNGYTLTLGAGDHGFALTRHTGQKQEPVADKPGEKLPSPATVRLSAKGGEFRVLVNGKEVFSASDATYTKGWCGLGITGGKATYSKLSVQGKLNPVELDKRFAEAEILVRRALEGDLSAENDAKELRSIELSVEDEFFMGRLPEDKQWDYRQAKETALRILQIGVSDREDLRALSLFDPVIDAAPEFTAARFWRGLLNLKFGNTTQARRDFVRCTRDPDFHEAFAAAALTWDDDQDYEKAAYYAEEAVKRMPDCASAIGLLGYLKFVTKGDAKAALEDLELAERLDPADEDTRSRRRSILNVVKGPEHLGCKFKKEFPHFWVLTDISMEKTQLYGERLEAAYKHFAETFKTFFKEDPKRSKPRVAVFNTREAYMTYGELTLMRRQEFTLGYFIASFRELLLFEDVDLDATLQTLYHESFHQFMSLMVPRPPYWYNEGIAEYMGAITVEKGKVAQKARILEDRLKILKRNLKHALPFESIMKQSPGQFYSGPVGFKYAQAWT
ncbi:MAG: hypothetical protein HYY16_07940, partial [Planctomycetes bacterium]|nr:hypothetical protein [Planctomycetota bacterium]